MFGGVLSPFYFPIVFAVLVLAIGILEAPIASVLASAFNLHSPIRLHKIQICGKTVACEMKLEEGKMKEA
ncbi:hypothetical protein V6N13_138638 [Hibiscus sabdariffa]|uniref:Uncharacterized protein n=1 Tax=Hibiscus sabdariffa TaxID=183260 RepID=A0ABR2PJS4_9ROSI